MKKNINRFSLRKFKNGVASVIVATAIFEGIVPVVASAETLSIPTDQVESPYKSILDREAERINQLNDDFDAIEDKFVGEEVIELVNEYQRLSRLSDLNETHIAGFRS
ncbi:YSIRK-type signal peptide-containing protein [Streptococcus sp. X16XC17]|uniref:YSIRK-type signal peptide-containing protein n=1 Tax=unclassified Streptococcus TaxID=2608887 RepID=UPI00066FEF74|nr:MULTISPECIES: YSIRK-type signal peptide-containing protein [unclassified Streptococcus]TCD46717.1 YSIRK-type signal peptide-containing protein [Streptococcus sp. X16XC17]